MALLSGGGDYSSAKWASSIRGWGYGFRVHYDYRVLRFRVCGMWDRFRVVILKARTLHLYPVHAQGSAIRPPSEADIPEGRSQQNFHPRTLDLVPQMQGDQSPQQKTKSL